MGIFADIGSFIEDVQDTVVTPFTDSVTDSATEIKQTVEELKTSVTETVDEISQTLSDDDSK